METLVTQTYSADTNMWTLSLPLTFEALDDLQKIIRMARENIKKSEVQANTVSGVESINNFIQNKFTVSLSSIITTDELRREYIKYSGTEITAHKFGRLMTSLINSDNNVYGVRRVAIRTGTGYGGIKMISTSQTNFINFKHYKVIY